MVTGHWYGVKITVVCLYCWQYASLKFAGKTASRKDLFLKPPLIPGKLIHYCIAMRVCTRSPKKICKTKPGVSFCRQYFLWEQFFLLAHIHTFKTFVPLVPVIFSFEQVSIEFSETPVEVNTHYLRITTAEYILRKIR